MYSSFLQETKEGCYSCVHLQLKPRPHCSEKYLVKLLKMLGRASAIFGRASENGGLLALPD